MILIEEPEVNLHPAFQSRLADMFMEAYQNYGIRFILETHSEYVLRKTQVLVKNFKEKNPEKPHPFGVYYFDKDKGPFKMEYRNDGKFITDFGTGFFDVSANLAFEII